MAKLLVTGAAGQLGQRVLHHLIDTLKVPAADLIAASRKPEALSAWAAKGVTARKADFEDPASLASAFDGAERVLLISTDAVDRPGRRTAQHEAAVKAAERAGVKHVVYTSMPKPENSPILIAPDHAATEAALAASALPGWSVLRNHWYFENLLGSLPNVIATGQWYSAAADGKVANIARDDLALAAAAALAATFDGKRTLTLSGGKARTTAEIAAAVSKATGKAIQVIQVPVDGLVQGIVAAGLPEPIARLIASFDANTAAGRAGEVTGDFKALTGKEPRPLEDWLAENKGSLVSPAAA